MSFWDKIRFFDSSEFDSPDEKGSGLKYMKESIVTFADQLRYRVRRPLKVNSGHRTNRHNKKVGGSKNSSHKKGYAIDTRCMTSSERFELIHEGMNLGVKRIGIYPTFIHFDTDPDKPQGVLWLKPSGIVARVKALFKREEVDR